MLREAKTLLASDMDGTVIPLEENPRRRSELAVFRDAVEGERGLGLAYVTGRDFHLALKGIHQHQLPHPDILVCDVGTSVYLADPSGFEEDLEYARLMEEARGGLDVRDVRHEVAHFPELLLQVEEKQTESKLSYHLTGDCDHAAVVEAVQGVLRDLGGGIHAVYSVGAPHGRGLLDLLPAGVAKGFALRYLHSITGVDAEAVMYAGDSGNDLDAMLTGFKVSVVGNAIAGLKEELTAKGDALGILHRIYFAEGCYSAGVLEGCRHFGIL